MKKIAGLWLVSIALLNSFSASAQTYAESALLFSRTMSGGSARIQALGGTQVSLGGDYSSGLSNPAGLGMFNKSEFTISPGMLLNSTTSDFANSPYYTGGGLLGPAGTPASKSTFIIPGISLVYKTNFNVDEDSPIRGGSLGISVSRTNDFNRSFSYKGNNPTTSLADYFVQNASDNPDGIGQFNGPDPNTGLPGSNYNYTPGLAYDSYLLRPTTANNGISYVSALGTDPTNAADKRTVDQREDITIKGSSIQPTIAYGLNLLDRIFLGANIGIPHISYQSVGNYYESNYKFVTDPTFNPVNQLIRTESLKTSGTGFNAGFGAIVRPVDFIQVGISYTTPSVYYMSDTYQATLLTDFNNFNTDNFYGPAGNNPNPDGGVVDGTGSVSGDPVLAQYKLITPSHLTFGSTVFIKKTAFISGDVELVNYAGAKYKPRGLDDTDHSVDNADIKTMAQQTLNYRVGGECRYKQFRIRAGYNFMPSPYRATSGSQFDKSLYGNGIKQEITSYSAGLGYRASRFYIDLAFVYRTGKTGYTPYSTYDYSTGSIPTNPTVTTTNKTSMVMVTVGIPFTRQSY